MASFNLQWRSSTKKDLKANSPPHEVQRILTEAESLADNPFPNGTQKLAGSDHTYRIRIGDYRIVYEIYAETKTVEVQRVGGIAKTSIAS